MKSKNYIELKDLEVYQLSRKLSTLAWEIYDPMDWQQKKVIGDQFIRSIDSVGANIAEGYGRYHYLDKVRFYYNSRGSLFEAIDHWASLLHERKMISVEQLNGLMKTSNHLQIKLNNLISSTFKKSKRK